MSIHKSLAARGKLVRARSVLTRYERILQLRRGGHWGDDSSPFGLPKVRVQKVKKRGKKEKKKEDEEGVTPEAAPSDPSEPK